ncbi:MAG: ROK family protein [Gemmatimonadota bacterium]|nr:MAG: ROK family protein [Gemmatimonadota bacterium]
MQTRIGIDLGGTKIEVIALDRAGAELFRRRIDTPRQYDGTLLAVKTLVETADDHTGDRGRVGIGIPGTISPVTGLVKNANSTWLIGHPLDKDLEDLLERPVRLMNDANCFALSEAVDGAGRDAKIVFGVILGTGVGGGIVVDKQVLDGAQKICGEWGHNALPRLTDQERPGPECYCGRRACIETFLSGPGMRRDHETATGVALSTHEIVTRANDGDDAALATLDRYVERLGRALATVINVLDPDVVVLGGGMSQLPDLAARAQAAIQPHVFTDEVTTRILQNEHGDSSGVRGAAWL